MGLVGFYADFDITGSDIKLLAYFSLQRGVIQAVLGCVAYFVLPWSSLKDRQAVTLAIFSPVVSITMHIFAENDYGERLLKLCVTGGLVNAVSCTLFQHFLIDFVFNQVRTP